jgi:hypothetical protein
MPISQPGSDYQLTTITLDAGHARDIMLILLDVHAVLDQLHLDGTQPQITATAEAILRESGSPYTLPTHHRCPRRGDRPAHPGDTPRHRGHPPGPAEPLTTSDAGVGPNQSATTPPQPSQMGPNRSTTVGPHQVDKARMCWRSSDW